MTQLKTAVKFLTIDEAHANQRIDNFLMGFLKGVPKSRVYRSLRQGEVRVNKGRVKPDYRLQLNDQIRIPPIRVSEQKELGAAPHWQRNLLAQSILYEDEGMIIINKPMGIAVHGGSGINFGVIETFRQLRPETKFLELVHRLDRDTSGSLMIAKKRAALVELQQLMRQHQIEKIYLTLVRGHWQGGKREIRLPLLKNQMQSGERMVQVSDKGKMAISTFEAIKYFATTNSTLVKVTLHTGRTHQIRVHAAHLHHPIAGDEKYGDKKFNQQMHKLGLKRLFLHAASLNFQLSSSGKTIAVCACMDKDLTDCLQKL